MIQELREYEIVVGGMREYVAAFREELVPLMERYDLELLGAWTVEVGELNIFYHLWTYPDLETMRSRYTALRSDPDWAGRFIPRAGHLLKSQKTSFVQPVVFTNQVPRFQMPTA